jgi:hypothetical protein
MRAAPASLYVLRVQQVLHQHQQKQQQQQQHTLPRHRLGWVLGTSMFVI